MRHGDSSRRARAISWIAAGAVLCLGCVEEIAPSPPRPRILDAGVLGDAVIDVSAGNATAEQSYGHESFGVDFSIFHGDRNRIEVRSTGRVDASFVPYFPSIVVLGTNPFIVRSDVVIELAWSEPTAGTPYLLDNDGALRIADGDGAIGDESAVSGLHVHPGATLTLALNEQDGARAKLELAHGLVMEGDLATPDRSPANRGSIWLSVEGDTVMTGRVLTHGTSPGQNAGHVHFRFDGHFYNHGDWLSYGADGVDSSGGEGGNVLIEAFEQGDSTHLESSGRIDARGGGAIGTLGPGGTGGHITIRSRGALRIAGSLDASGGASVDGGGPAGSVRLTARRGALQNAARLIADGGDGGDGLGGAGGVIRLAAAGGDLWSSGGVSARGADVRNPEFDYGLGGGDGGEIEFAALATPAFEEVAIPAGDIWVSGTLDAAGGDAPNFPARGGSARFLIDNRITRASRAIHLLGYERVDARGGDGDLLGGRGGRARLQTSEIDGGTRGQIVFEPLVITSGGHATPESAGSQGGDGGDILYQSESIELGPVVTDGGDGETPGADGVVGAI